MQQHNVQSHAVTSMVPQAQFQMQRKNSLVRGCTEQKADKVSANFFNNANMNAKKMKRKK